MSSSAGNLKRKKKIQEMSLLWLFRLSAGTTDTSNVTLINQKKHVFSGNNQLNQSGAKEAQPIISDICFPVLGTGYWFSRAWLSMFSRALHWRVHCFPALGTISLFPPKRQYRLKPSSSNWNIALFLFLANFQVSLTSLVCPKSERFPVLGI